MSSREPVLTRDGLAAVGLEGVTPISSWGSLVAL